MIDLRSLKKITVERTVLENRQKKKKVERMKVKTVFWFYVRIYIIKFSRHLAIMIPKFLAPSLLVFLLQYLVLLYVAPYLEKMFQPDSSPLCLHTVGFTLCHFCLLL